MNDVLSSLIRAALEHQGAHLRFDGNGDINQVIPVEPAAVRYLSLNEVLTPKSGSQTTFNGVIAKRSLVAAAGAEIIRIPGVSQQSDLDANGDRRPLKQVEVPRHYVVTAAGQFKEVADGDEITMSGQPWLAASYDDTTAPSYGIGYTLSRRDLKHAFADDTVLRSVNSAIESGIARLADLVLLGELATTATALLDANLPTIVVPVAAKGIRWNELSAIAGKAGAGVALGGDGSLMACNVKAELTDTVRETIIGDFTRAAVAIDDDVRVTVRRTGNGSVEIVCWVNAQALVPDAGYFWKFGA